MRTTFCGQLPGHRLGEQPHARLDARAAGRARRPAARRTRGRWRRPARRPVPGRRPGRRRRGTRAAGPAGPGSGAASSPAALVVNVRPSTWSGRTSSLATSQSTRADIVSVLPEPAPATTTAGPSGAPITAACSGVGTAAGARRRAPRRPAGRRHHRARPAGRTGSGPRARSRRTSRDGVHSVTWRPMSLAGQEERVAQIRQNAPGLAAKTGPPIPCAARRTATLAQSGSASSASGGCSWVAVALGRRTEVDQHAAARLRGAEGPPPRPPAGTRPAAGAGPARPRPACCARS